VICHYAALIRRLALVVGLSVLLVLGFGGAYALSGALDRHTRVVICHIPPGNPENAHTIIVDDDAVPAHLAHGDYLGRCGSPVTSTTLTTPTTTTVPIDPTIPPTTVTLPPETTSTVITDTVTVPPETSTVPVPPTTVTVPPDATTTVTVPGQTVTQPPVTSTLPGLTIERPPETVTLPGATTTVSATGTTMVVTITGPNEVVDPGLVVKKKIEAKIKTRRVVHVAAHVRRVQARVRFLVKTVIVAVAGIQAKSCPPGTALFNGTCQAVVRGKG
jgi:hypothetical protein